MHVSESPTMPRLPRAVGAIASDGSNCRWRQNPDRIPFVGVLPACCHCQTQPWSCPSPVRDRLKSSHFFFYLHFYEYGGEGGKPHMKIEKKCDFADQHTWYRLSKNTDFTFTWGKKKTIFSLKMVQCFPVMGGFLKILHLWWVLYS